MSNLQFVDILLHMVRRQLQCFQLFKKSVYKSFSKLYRYNIQAQTSKSSQLNQNLQHT